MSSTNKVKYPKGVLNPFPYKSPYKNGQKYSYSHYTASIWSKNKPAKSKKSESNFLNILNAIATPFIGLVGLGLSALSMVNFNKTQNQSQSQSQNQSQNSAPSVLKTLGETNGAKALNTGLTSFAEAKTDEDKSKAIETMNNDKAYTDYKTQLLDSAKKEVEEKDTITKDGQTNLEEFSQQFKVKEDMTDAEKASYSSLIASNFKLYDVNGDGQISAEERAAHFAAMDINGDGKIDSNESLVFDKLVTKYGKESNKKLEDAFVGKRNTVFNLLFDQSKLKETK